MKTKPYVDKQKLGPHGEVTIPPDYLKELGLYPGEEVELRLAGKDLLLSPVKEAIAYKNKSIKDPVKALTGSIPIDDPKLIDEIIESEDIYG